MLITDNDIVTLADLNAVDPEVGTLSKAMPNVPPITGPESVIRQAADHVCRMIESQWQNFSGYLMSPGNSANQVAAVMNVYSTSVTRPRFRQNMVVAIEPDPTKHHIRECIKYYSLYAMFRSQYHRKIDDRFGLKMNFYDGEYKRAWQRFQATGCPIVLSPLVCPGAVREYQAGTWGNSNVTAGSSGSTETGNEYDVVISYVGQAYTSWTKPNNSESAPSAIVTIQASEGQVLTVDISTLNPPNGNMPNVGTADGVYSPMPATGWLIYAAPTGQTPVLQTSSPIAIGTQSYTLPNAPVTNGQTVGVGQFPDYNYAWVRVLNRA